MKNALFVMKNSAGVSINASKARSVFLFFFFWGGGGIVGRGEGNHSRISTPVLIVESLEWCESMPFQSICYSERNEQTSNKQTRLWQRTMTGMERNAGASFLSP